jgi:hypothetical protein
MMFHRSEDGPTLTADVVEQDGFVCLDRLFRYRSLVRPAGSGGWQSLSADNGSGNNLIFFEVDAFDIRRSSVDKLSGAFRDTPQDFIWIRTKRQSLKEIPKSFFLAPVLVNRPQPYPDSCARHKAPQPGLHAKESS